MEARAVTVGIPVRELGPAVEWYRAAFGLGEPDLVPMEGLAEYDLGAFWLQLAAAPERAGREGLTVNISVADAGGLREELAGKGLEVSEVERYEGVVEFFALTDLDGNTIGFVTELA